MRVSANLLFQIRRATLVVDAFVEVRRKPCGTPDTAIAAPLRRAHIPSRHQLITNARGYFNRFKHHLPIPRGDSGLDPGPLRTRDGNNTPQTADEQRKAIVIVNVISHFDYSLQGGYLAARERDTFGRVAKNVHASLHKSLYE
jgi:hypothetical protein